MGNPIINPIWIIRWRLSMVRLFPVLAAFFLLAGSLGAQEEKSPSDANIALYKKISPAIVSVMGGGQIGSGVVINPAGVVLTSTTACGRSSSSARIRFANQKEFSAKVLGRVDDLEMVVLQITGKGPFPYLELGDSDRVQLGQLAYSLGDSFGSLSRDGQVHMSMGIISGRYKITVAKNRRAKYKGTVLETSAAVNQNQDGGPIVDRHGKVIGIITLNYHDAKFTGISVPVNILKRDLLRIAPALGNLVHVRQQGTPWMGMTFLETPDGLVIDRVFRKGPAEKAGLLKGDFISRINEKKIRTMRSVKSLLRKQGPGDFLEFRVSRRGKQETLKLLLVKKPVY